MKKLRGESTLQFIPPFLCLKQFSPYLGFKIFDALHCRQGSSLVTQPGPGGAIPVTGVLNGAPIQIPAVTALGGAASIFVNRRLNSFATFLFRRLISHGT